MSVETRLTAEQWLTGFCAERGVGTKGMFTFKGTCDLAEAFRDKSEAELQKELKLWKRSMCVLYELIEGKECPTPQAAIGLVTSSVAGLREEIERLKGERAGLWHEEREERHARERAEADLAALRERERWIPVEEKLPERGQKVLTIQRRANNEIITETSSQFEGEWYVEDQSFEQQPVVTHWKALSAAPEVKS